MAYHAPRAISIMAAWKNMEKARAERLASKDIGLFLFVVPR
jgi:hypothetical protein